MADTKVTFISEGRKLAGTVRVPDGVKPGERRPAFIVMHGFGSNSSSSNVLEPCAMFEKLGYVTLRFDMPGCGESEGERGNLICLEQVQAASDGLTFLAKHPNVERRPHRHDRLELRRGDRGLCRSASTSASRRRSRRAAGATASASSAASIRSPEAWKKFTDMLAEGKRHREKTGQSLMVPRYDIVPIPEHLRGHLRQNSIRMFTAETAQSMYDFRADDVIGNAAGRPILLLHSSVDSVTPTEQSIEMFKRAAAVRPAPVRRDRPLHVRGEQHPRAHRDLRLARQVFPGPGARGGGVDPQWLKRWLTSGDIPIARACSRSRATRWRLAAFRTPMRRSPPSR